MKHVIPRKWTFLLFICMRVCMCTFYIFIVVDYFIKCDTSLSCVFIGAEIFRTHGLSTYVKYTQQTCTHTTDTIIAVKASTCIYDRINPRKYQVQWHKCGLINTSERLRLRIKSRRAISPKDRSSPIYGLLIYMALVKTLSRSKL